MSVLTWLAMIMVHDPRPTKRKEESEEAFVTDVRLEKVIKNYGSLVALNNISFECRDGEFFTFLGLSGAGKTTTLHLPRPLSRSDLDWPHRSKDDASIHIFLEWTGAIVYECSEIDPTYLLEPKSFIGGFYGVGNCAVPLGNIVHRYE